MRGVDGMIRLSKWRLDERRRELRGLEDMLAGLVGELAALSRELESEQTAARRDNVISLYGSYAKSVINRRENLERSIEETEVAVEEKKDEVSAAFQDLKRYEIAAERAARRAAEEYERRDQAALDEIALSMHRRKVS